MVKLHQEIQNSDQSRPVSVAIYTCAQYVLLIGCMQKRFFLVDSHPVVEDDCGNQTGVALFSDGHSTQATLIYEWITQRLQKSGVALGSMQSFAILRYSTQPMVSSSSVNDQLGEINYGRPDAGSEIHGQNSRCLTNQTSAAINIDLTLDEENDPVKDSDGETMSSKPEKKENSKFSLVDLKDSASSDSDDIALLNANT